MLDISAIILTGNEEIHIKRCLDGISFFVKEVFIIDCYATDRTLEIAQQYDNVTVLHNKWENYAAQFNWALDNAPIKTKWVLRLDADEYLTEELKAELRERIPLMSDNVTGCSMFLRRVFLGKTIKHGMPRIKQMRLFVYGAARCEVRLMDEHIQLLRGDSVEMNGEFVDDNLNDLSWWSEKHIGYAIREAVDLLDIEYDLYGAAKNDGHKRLTDDAVRKRKMKHRYAMKPLFWRSFAYFVYRYFFKLGFLDGKEGFLWHFLQGWWYRTLCDAKVFEIKKACGNNPQAISEYLENKYGIMLNNVKKRGGVI